jgi:hypothetical protein
MDEWGVAETDQSLRSAKRIMYLAFGIDTGHRNCRQLATHCTGVDAERVGLSRAGKETRQAVRSIPRRNSVLIVLLQVWITSMTRA